MNLQEWMNEYDHLVEQPKTPNAAPAPEPASPMSIPTSPPQFQRRARLVKRNSSPLLLNHLNQDNQSMSAPNSPLSGTPTNGGPRAGWLSAKAPSKLKVGPGKQSSPRTTKHGSHIVPKSSSEIGLQRSRSSNNPGESAITAAIIRKNSSGLTNFSMSDSNSFHENSDLDYDSGNLESDEEDDDNSEEPPPLPSTPSPLTITTNRHSMFVGEKPNLRMPLNSPSLLLRTPSSGGTSSTTLVSDNIFDTITDPALPLYRMSRIETDVFLRNQPTGTVLLRPSSLPGCITFSFQSVAGRQTMQSQSIAKKVRHLLIGLTRAGLWCEADSKATPLDPKFISLRDCLRHMCQKIGATDPLREEQYQPLVLPPERIVASSEWSQMTPLVTLKDDVGTTLDDGKSRGIALPRQPNDADVQVYCDSTMSRDLYLEEFWGHPHVLLIGEKSSESNSDITHEIIAVRSVAQMKQFQALRITGKNTQMFYINGSDLQPSRKSGNKTLEIQLERYLNSSLSQTTKFTYRYVKQHTQFAHAVKKIEAQHPQSRKQVKLAFLYSTNDDPGGRECEDNAANSGQMQTFLNEISEEIDLSTWQGYRGDMGRDVQQKSMFARWRDMEFMLHVSTLLSREQHRRLIGNDVGVVLFRPSNAGPLDVDSLDLGTVPQVFGVVQPVVVLFRPSNAGPLDIDSLDLGTVPQVFGVVQPVDGRKSSDGKQLYRVCFFARSVVKGGAPLLPWRVLFTASELKPLLLCRMANDVNEAMVHAPPMNRLFFRPRQATLDDICMKEGAPESSRAAAQRAKHEAAGRKEPKRGSHIESLNVQPRRPSSVTTMGIAERTAGIKKAAHNVTLTVNVSLVIKLQPSANNRFSESDPMYVVVRMLEQEAKSPSRKGPQPVFAFNATLKLSGVALPTNDVFIELWRDGSIKLGKPICVGQWRNTLTQVLTSLSRRRTVAILLQRRPEDSKDRGTVGELLCSFEVEGAQMHTDGEFDLKTFEWYHGPMSSSEAFTLLAPLSEGSFLVRLSTKQEDSYVVSYKSASNQSKSRILHVLLTKKDG
eukprot:CAMPEP_0168587994 /NCGR_PEP_ID=MMETSP0420-20121227/5192_1 /TAXON_ID=498008 /ORGANISM="Pessonella sp." /LENGTH=1047 /DNA_ID=CAMNT_0008623345 /DNA_START=22 /DNA_END=3161 /DNA_ORIENTATION=-